MLIDQQRKLDLNPAALPAGIISGLKFDPSGKRLALTIESVHSPRDVYVLEPETQALTRWTQSELGLLDAGSLRGSRRCAFRPGTVSRASARMLSALVYRADWHAGRRCRQRRPRPLARDRCCCCCAAAAAASAGPASIRFLQYLISELGVVVVAPNVRGSTGFGRSSRSRPGRAARRCRARHRLAAGMDRSAARARSQPRGAARRGLRRLSGAAIAGGLWRSAARRHRRLPAAARRAGERGRRSAARCCWCRASTIRPRRPTRWNSCARACASTASRCSTSRPLTRAQDSRANPTRDAYREAAANFLAQLLR